MKIEFSQCGTLLIKILSKITFFLSLPEYYFCKIIGKLCFFYCYFQIKILAAGKIIKYFRSFHVIMKKFIPTLNIIGGLFHNPLDEIIIHSTKKYHKEVN